MWPSLHCALVPSVSGESVRSPRPQGSRRKNPTEWRTKIGFLGQFQGRQIAPRCPERGRQWSGGMETPPSPHHHSVKSNSWGAPGSGSKCFTRGGSFPILTAPTLQTKEEARCNGCPFPKSHRLPSPLTTLSLGPSLLPNTSPNWTLRRAKNHGAQG